jgi:predicted ester cyclase
MGQRHYEWGECAQDNGDQRKYSGGIRMSIEENKAFIRSYLGAFSGKDKPKEKLEQFIADPELIQHGLATEAAFPKYELFADEMAAEGDRVWMMGRLRGVHTGEFHGIPPTGKQVECPLAVIYRLADGKIAESWVYTDRMTMLEQLGVMPG